MAKNLGRQFVQPSEYFREAKRQGGNFDPLPWYKRLWPWIRRRDD